MHRNFGRPGRIFAMVLTASSLAIAHPTSAVAAQENMSAGYKLESTGQAATETLASQIVATREMQSKIADIRRLFRADPDYALPDASQDADEAVQELAYLTALFVANNDPERPALTWVYRAPYKFNGHAYRGSRAGIENPDTIYWMLQVDNKHHYRLTGRRTSDGPAHFSLELWDAPPGFRPQVRHIGMLRDSDLMYGPDGSFEILIGSEPSSGRSNYLQLPETTGAVFVRNTLADWLKERPVDLKVELLDKPSNLPRSMAAMTKETVKAMESGAKLYLAFKDQLFDEQIEGAKVYKDTYANKLNQLKPTVLTREGGWSHATGTKFRLADDEALVITLDDGGAKYFAIQLADVWGRSLDPRFMTSRNVSESSRNADGSMTYVISPKNPGVQNWLDTRGRHAGSLLIRWQSIKVSAANPPLVRNSAVMSIGGLKKKNILPNVTKGEQHAELERRKQGYERRFQ